MRKLLALVAIGVLFVGGCSSNESTDTTAQQTQVHVNIVDSLGLPNAGVTVIVAQHLGSNNTEQIGEEVTDANGAVTFTVPENITAAVGTWKQVTENVDNPNYTWQYPFIVPPGGTTLTYVYQPNGTQCAVVQPGQPDPCPSAPAESVDSPTSTATPTPDASSS